MWAICGWLIDALIRWCRDYRTRNWPTAKGQVESRRVTGSSVVVNYAYKVDDEWFAGVHEKFCFDSSSAEEHAKRFVPKWSLVVRFSGADPARAVVVEDDQVMPPVWATRYREN